MQTGHCPDVFFSTNMKTCFGYMDAVGADTIPAVLGSVVVPHRLLRAAERLARHADLIINGVVGQADVWVNGHEIATQATVQGDYTRYTFDVTGLLQRRR